MHPHSCATIDAIARFAESAPHSPALICPDGIVLDYEKLNVLTAAVAERLKNAGIEHHQAVAVLIPQGTLQIIAVTGVLKYCVCTPLHPRTTTSEVREALADLQVVAVLLTADFDAEAEAASSMGLVVLLADEQTPPNRWEIRHPRAKVDLHFASADAVLVLTTSATSGNSKYVPLTATNLDAQAEPRARRLILKSSDRLLQMTSLSHSMGIDNTLAQFSVGGSIIATNGFESSDYLHWLDELRPTWYDCSPTVHQAALEKLKQERPNKPISLRFIQSAGAPLPGNVMQDLEQILEVPVLSDYGMTETGPIASDAFLPGSRVPGSVGRTSGLEIGIMTTFGDLVPPLVEGEIVVRGPAVFSGYINNPGANSDAFRNGWFCTGDLGRLDPEGNLFLTGRLKEMINRGGEKILPAEIDTVLASHPAVRECASFAVPHPTLGEDVACAVVLRFAGEHPVSTAELRRFAAQNLATFKVPRRIYFVDEIPHGEQGKPQRWLLAQRFGAKYSLSALPVQKLANDVDDIIYKLHEIWARVLNRIDLDFDEDFFSAGGDSLAAINMLAEVDQRFHSQTSASADRFFDEPTLVHLAELLGKPPMFRPSDDSSNDIRMFSVRENASCTRLFCVPADGDEGLYFRRLATHLDNQMGLSILRPMNTFYSQELFTFEHAGKTIASIIRKAQPEGPYLVGGFCYGGIICVETARQLRKEGQDVRLILFDVPTPGFPGLIGYCGTWVERGKRKWRALRGEAAFTTPSVSAGAMKQTLSDSVPNRMSRTLTWIVANLSLISHRLLWYAAVPLRGAIAPIQEMPIVRSLLRWTQKGNFPLYRANSIDAPILHFLCSDEPELIDIVTRYGWRKVAQRGIVEEVVPYDHYNLLHESNLPRIARAILKWSEANESKTD
jgi:oxalate---CoA ligase